MTFLELIVVTMIISVIFALILSAVHYTRERAKIQDCQNNLRQLGTALNCYMITWKNLPPAASEDDDNLSPLYPRWCDNLRLFMCVMAGSEVRGPEDLVNNATRVNGYGHSYDYLSFSLYDRNGQPLSTPQAKTHSTIDRDPEVEWLLMDSMELGVPNQPDLEDNHRDLGGNVLFADGHVKWINQIDWKPAFVSGNSFR